MAINLARRFETYHQLKYVSVCKLWSAPPAYIYAFPRLQDGCCADTNGPSAGTHRSQDTDIRPNPTTVGLSWAKREKWREQLRCRQHRTGLDTHSGRTHARSRPALPTKAAAQTRQASIAAALSVLGQRQHRNALFQQLQRLINVCLPANGALVSFTPMHFAGFFGEAFAHVLRLSNGLPASAAATPQPAKRLRVAEAVAKVGGGPEHWLTPKRANSGAER